MILFGVATLTFCGRVLFQSPLVPVRKVIMFFAVIFAVYLQIQLPLLIG